MRHASFGILLASSFACAVAVAQQGLIVQPWSKGADRSRAAFAVSTQPESASQEESHEPPGGPNADGVPAARPGTFEGKWAAPIVALLVDPWAKPGELAGKGTTHWVPEGTEIVDPWAREATAPSRPRR